MYALQYNSYSVILFIENRQSRKWQRNDAKKMPGNYEVTPGISNHQKKMNFTLRV